MDYDHIAETGSKITYAGGGSAFLFGMTANEIAAIGGLIIASIGLIINAVFKWLGHRALLEHHRKIEAGEKDD